ncbi:MAG TPA: HDOD domain-containing protein, partial [Planctomycetota bacterium]|nr:HDOD domain-containing protein [Planctomycetota bacterium]
MTKRTLPPRWGIPMPALPASGARTLRLLQQRHVEPSQILRVMESDEPWAREVLQLAGPFGWGRVRSPEDPTEALAQLGQRRFYQLAWVAAIVPVLREPVPGYGLLEGELWDHSLAVALATREVFLEKGLRPCEEAFTAAMLHDVGKVILGGMLETDPAPGAEMTYEEAELRAAGMDHAEAGAVFLEHWKLPPWLITAVRFHHAPVECSFLIPDLIHLADAVCLSLGVGAG